ncbi:MAG: UDP-glucose--hexose-1-phosphate uridylyltransferase [Spirochaetaceae bacterium]
MDKIAKLIEELIQFGLKHKMIERLDIPLVRNQLMYLLKVSEPFAEVVDDITDETPVRLLNLIILEALERGLIEDTLAEKDILDAQIMATFMPRQSELNNIYEGIKKSDGPTAATDYYYKLSQLSNYIRTDRIAHNKYWTTGTDYGDLEITINLSKPEKDPKEIAKAAKMPQSKYPKCLLCLENVGYVGNINHPARTSHRVLPLTLNKEEWCFQYSPYVYYNEHAIIFKAAHEPMKITKESFIRLTDFVEAMPHYFIGSNADLPIVGGSILSHDHFQGGNHKFPMVDVKTLKTYQNSKYKDVIISMVEWPMSVIRLTSENKGPLVELATELLTAWRIYSDKSIGIFSETLDGSISTPHNTITPIARVNDKGLFEIDLVLRNNRTDKDHPDGIYHPHKHLHHIKKENIGLIEVMGLAILPARINTDIQELSTVLQGDKALSYVEENMDNHYEWFEGIVIENGTHLSKDEADKVLKEAVGRRFKEVLDCAGVFKMTPVGIEAFDRFIQSVGCNLK